MTLWHYEKNYTTITRIKGGSYYLEYEVESNINIKNKLLFQYKRSRKMLTNMYLIKIMVVDIY